MKKLAATLLTAALTACTAPAINTPTVQAVANTPASPTVIDTPAAKVIVIRPSEQWTPKQAVLDNYDAGMREKRYLLAAQDQNGKKQFATSSELSGWLKAAVDDMAEAGWKASGWMPKNISTIGPAKTMTGDEYNKVIGIQKQYFKALTEKAGSPERQKTKHKVGSALSMALAIGTLGAGSVLDLPSHLQWLTTDLAEMIGSIPPALLTVVSPNWPSARDFSPYPAIDVRLVTSNLGGVFGQIVIAYKGAKTPEAEEEAMAKAARAIVGVDTSLEKIKGARLEDYNRRAAIWKDCVADGRCKE
ncbi:hypothetical protein BGZ96_006786 [Linnemannia gamsii]|uniref:Lipoprotein n=1 Tax=Linnemannia gamsii TaxID=64522 RepID=A0ABQ7K2C0_9FUNG|nr:hypothetical protein BGZ96_006786 [Linnemannia gamsii]